MSKKSVFRRLSKWLVLSPEFRDVADREDDDVIETTAVRRESSAIGTAMVESLRLAEAPADDAGAITHVDEPPVTEHRDADAETARLRQLDAAEKDSKSAAFTEFLYDIQDARSVAEADVLLAKLRSSNGTTKSELSAAMAAFDARIGDLAKSKK